MTVDEAKKILLAANLSPLEKNALHVLLEKIDCEDLPGEEWRDVVGYEGLYQVSNCGRVKSFHKVNVKILKPKLVMRGYLSVSLQIDCNVKWFKVHRLVAQAFIPNPDDKPQVNHIDGNKQNNYVSNLEWVTPAENIHHGFVLGLHKSGCRHGRAKFTAEQVREIRRDCVPGDPERGFNAFARKFNVTPKIVRDVFYGKSYKYVE